MEKATVQKVNKNNFHFLVCLNNHKLHIKKH